MHKLAIFASGGGSNAECLIQHFNDKDIAKVSLIVSNKSSAYVLQRAANHQLPHQVITNKQLKDSQQVLALLEEHQIDYIILAGFLSLIPAYLIQKFPKRIINIHPALLPKYGGKGMYGKYVHQAVFDNFEKESGMTIHYVDPAYDEGQIIFQAKVALEDTDTPDIIAQKVLKLEHLHYGPVVEQVLVESQETKA